ncbi:hypothetical protein PCASD_19420 [Puccinia coronata f. sp. avenae]|uniref:Uncharacterized protein n=1 Tax=Puccinia coronata f. sp. avenae TaxID=200324 RepID=A0A2N5SGA4_9BASI|nr:hypothetical protein PCASD_19420 [Puccinia coronata f. sp. avenae]
MHHPTRVENRSSTTATRVYPRIVPSSIVTDHKLLQELDAVPLLLQLEAEPLTISGSLHLQISPLPSQPESTTTSVALGRPVMLLDEQEELFSFYGHAELVKKRVKQSLATSRPGLAELTLQVEGIRDGSKNCFCLTGQSRFFIPLLSFDLLPPQITK